MLEAFRMGFTGTQKGMSDRQKAALRRVLVGVSELHHGDCVGADEEADAVARELGIAVVIHPPVDPVKRAFCARPGDVVLEPLPYMERNRAVVDSTFALVAAPLSDREAVRSGTWSTVRHARRTRKPVLVLPR